MQKVKRFLQERWEGSRPLLVGYSGGPDSEALLQLVLEAKIPCHVAHVDHGWRAESAREAEHLKSRISVPFHTLRLPVPPEKNREEAAREGRLAFFRTLFAGGHYQALLLGHQADDLAETVLKRLFEGAHLVHLGSMEKISQFEELVIWRPLLNVRRREIEAYLEKKGITPLIDPTNSDPAYLRARMRKELFPFLKKSFGKEVVSNLALLSERAGELERYLGARVAGRTLQEGVWGWAVDCKGLARIEARHLLQAQGLQIPRTVLEPLLDWWEQKLDHRKIFFNSMWLIHCRGWVFFWKKALPEKEEIRKLSITFDATHSRPDK